MAETRNIVLFQHNCKECSKIGQMVAQLAIEGLEARPLSDPQVVSLLTSAGLSVPTRPALLVIDGSAVQLLTGLAMRRRLAAVVGFRRARTIVGLLAAEWRAKLANAASSYQPSRRGVVGGAIAGLAGLLMTSGVAEASPRRAESEPSIKRAAPHDVGAVLATLAVRRAIQTWGQVDPDVYEAVRNGQRTLMLLHPAHDIFTLVDGSTTALRSGNPVAVSLGSVPAAEKVFRYYTVGGTPLADMAVTNGKVDVTAAPRDAYVPGSNHEAEPAVPAHYYCFVGCINGRVTMGCFDTCSSCSDQMVINRNWQTAFTCLNCAFCAGPHAFSCIRECWFGT
jgi:hypothetical protein